MIIANPIYDVVFKRLMENDKVVKFFIGTLLDEEIEAVELKPQEFTYIKDIDLDDPIIVKYVKERIKQRLSINVFRLDFLATIRTQTGELKKILIEVQKAQHLIDIMRFRNYLAEQYKRTDQVNNENKILPITTIYILGFTLPEIESPCIKVERNYKDLINKNTIKAKSDFIEKLTHDSFVVQVERITDRYQTRLDKLLSVFAQQHFVDDREIIKEFKHEPDLEEIRTMTDILHYVGTDPKEKKEIETEQEAWRTINAFLKEQEERAKRYLAQLEENQKALEEKEKALEEKDKALEESQKAFEETTKVLEEKDKALEETTKVLEEKDKALEENQKALEEKERLISELLRKLDEQK